MNSVFSMRSAATAIIAATALAACGPNVFRAQGTVMNPTYVYASGAGDTPRTPRILTIIRKETRTAASYRIRGRYDKPAALLPFVEYAEIPEQRTDGTALMVNTRIFSNYRNEMDLEKDYEYFLELPDGRIVKGSLHVQHAIKDYSTTVEGTHMQTHQTIRDSTGVHRYRHVEVVTNDFELFSRTGRVMFSGKGLVEKDTDRLVFVVKGYQREWRYTFNLTNDPETAAQSEIETAEQ
jgi:hypothetical protein